MGKPSIFAAHWFELGRTLPGGGGLRTCSDASCQTLGWIPREIMSEARSGLNRRGIIPILIHLWHRLYWEGSHQPRFSPNDEVDLIKAIKTNVFLSSVIVSILVYSRCPEIFPLEYSIETFMTGRAWPLQGSCISNTVYQFHFLMPVLDPCESLESAQTEAVAPCFYNENVKNVHVWCKPGTTK